MIYMNHDIYSNITASLKSGDTELTTDILVNEISDFIVYDTKKFVEVLTKSGIQASEKMTDETLVDLYLKNLPINKNLAKAMGFQIADSNGLVNNSSGSDASKKKQIAVIDTISSGIANIANEMIDNPNLSSSIKADIMGQIVAKSKAKGNYQRVIFNSKNKIIYWILGGIIVIGIGYMIYRHRKLKMEAGGIIPPAVSTSEPPVQMNQPPVNNVPIQNNSTMVQNQVPNMTMNTNNGV